MSVDWLEGNTACSKSALDLTFRNYPLLVTTSKDFALPLFSISLEETFRFQSAAFFFKGPSKCSRVHSPFLAKSKSEAFLNPKLFFFFLFFW
jgi:hypothetical protein